MAERVQQAPFGDIVFVNTPKIDQMGARLYAEQKQREAYLQRNAEMLDKTIASSASKLRDADVDGYYDMYNTYKKAWMDLQTTNPKGKEFLQKQTNLNRIKAELDTYGNRSVQEKEAEKMALAGMVKNPDDFEEDAMGFLQERMKTPVNKFKMQVPNPKTGGVFEIDMGDIYGNTMYKGNKTNFLPYIQKAVGQNAPTTLTTFDTPVGDTQIQKNKIVGINKTAPEIATALVSQLTGRSFTDLPKAFKDYNPEYVQKINEQYDALVNSDLYKKAYKGKRMDFPEYMNETMQGRIAMMIAKETALQNAPKEIQDGRPYILADKMFDKRTAAQKEAATLRYRRSIALIAQNKANGVAPDAGLQHPFDRLEANYGFKLPTGETFIPEEAISPKEMSEYNPRDRGKGMIPVEAIEVDYNGKKIRGFTVNDKGDLVGSDGIIKRYDAAVEAVKDVNTKRKEQNVNAMMPKPSGSKQKPAGASGITWK